MHRIIFSPSVGALRKHAGGMFLASDLGGYAAVAATSLVRGRQRAYEVLPIPHHPHFYQTRKKRTATQSAFLHGSISTEKQYIEEE